jgi:hypothetical protein
MWHQLKGKPFSFHNVPGICWPCVRRHQIRPRFTCRFLCLWKGGFSFQLLLQGSHSNWLVPIRRNSISEDCVISNGLYNSTVSKDCALDCPSEHFEPNFEPQLSQHHANDTASCYCELNTEVLIPKNLSHSISVRGENVDDVLVIPLELHGMVSCFPTFKPTQLDFETL